jgi:hypothetical protein
MHVSRFRGSKFRFLYRCIVVSLYRFLVVAHKESLYRFLVVAHKELTEQQTQVLAKGLNYNKTDAKKLDFIADLESALKNTELTEETKNNIRHQVTTNLLHLNNPIDLTKQEREALDDLKKDDDIVILPSDKGRVTVVMDKSDYTNKAKTLINVTNTYQPLDTDPSKTTVNRINKKIKSLKDQDKLNKRTYDQIRPKDATIAKFYGLPKINNPLRPIVSLPGSPTYNYLSKYLADI